MRGKVGEKRLVDGRIGDAHVVYGMDDAASHELRPDAVGEVAAEEAVFGRRQPLGECLEKCLSLPTRASLDIRQNIRQICRMQTTVTELLREFPKVRRAVLSGETVIIRSREGNMRLTLDHGEDQPRVGALRGLVQTQEDLAAPTTVATEWSPSL